LVLTNDEQNASLKKPDASSRLFFKNS